MILKNSNGLKRKAVDLDISQIEVATSGQGQLISLITKTHGNFFF